ncbi:Ferric-chelate reductase 1 [Aphelenchoides fujianensis]|nr:Ferric-chelate reductase 1 [Aphelenchoides fujianensis]
MFRTSGCGETKAANCVPYVDCSYAFSFVRDSSHVFMEIFGQLPLGRRDTGGFVAVGFSKDDLMGSDTVTDCSSFMGRPFVGRLSYNPGKSNRRVPLDEDTHNRMLQTIISHYVNGTLYCKLAQSIIPVADIKEYLVRPLDVDYFILMSSGPTDGEELMIHSLDDTSERFPFISAGPVNGVDVSNETTSIDLINITDIQDANGEAGGGPRPHPSANMTRKEKLRIWDMVGPGETRFHETDRKTRNRLTNAHSLLMIVSWVIFVPLAILIARYTRPNWPEKRILGAPLWLNAHRTLNLLAVVCTAVSCFCIFYAHGFHWHGLEAFQTQEWEHFHGLFGFIACWFVWFQLVNSFARCRVGTRPRGYHNILHRTCGLTGWLLGTTTLGIAFWHLPRFMNVTLARTIFIVYLVVFLLSLCMLEPLKWRLHFQQRDQVAAANTEAEWDERGHRTAKTVAAQRIAQQFAFQRQQEQKIHRFQTITVCACALVATISSLLFVVLIVFRDY